MFSPMVLSVSVVAALVVAAFVFRHAARHPGGPRLRGFRSPVGPSFPVPALAGAVSAGDGAFPGRELRPLAFAGEGPTRTSAGTPCPGCGKPLEEEAPEGLCPACLLRGGLASGLGDVGSGPAEGAGFLPPEPAELAADFPQLEVLELIGHGGMGAVYRARQPSLDRFVALKILSPRAAAQAGFAERFSREAKALARLRHPNIVAVHEAGRAGEHHYLVMEYVDGTDLRRVLRAKTLTPAQALRIVPEVCSALEYAHGQGVVHRDIKPENILLDGEGRVHIADFGLAKILNRPADPFTLTRDCQVMGTPHYMAPEQVEHPLEVDHRADIYSLGVVLYEMLTGELPLGRFAPPSRKVQVDVRLDEVVLKALEKEPARRYQQAGEVKTDVEYITSTEAPTPRARAAADPAGRSAAPRDTSPRLCKTAVVGAVWAILGPAAALPVFGAYFFLDAPRASAGPPTAPSGVHVAFLPVLLIGFPLALLLLSTPIGSTLCGCVAIARIRRSAGRLYGVGLALFDALVYPLLLADVILLVLGLLALRLVGAWGIPIRLSRALIVVVAIPAVVIFDLLVIRRVRRSVSKPIVGG